MKTAKHTAEEKKAYYANIRARWLESKRLAANGHEAEAIIREQGLNCSITGYVFVLQQMRALGLDGFPYVDAKTFNGWKDSGFCVRKGEHSRIDGLTWITTTKKEADTDEETTSMYPKVYHLFHRSQVEEI